MNQKTIVVAGFKGGVGKSTIANFLAEKLGDAVIFNLDLYQDNEDFNSAETINIERDEDLKEVIENKSHGICIIDAGGFDDARLYDLEVDLFIFPTRSDYRSIKTTLDSAATVIDKSESLTKRAMFILNMLESDREEKTAIEILEQLVSISEIDAELFFFAMKKSAAITTAINEKKGLEELAGQSKFAARAYASVNESFEELAKEVKEIIE